MVWHTFSSPNGVQSLFVEYTFNISRKMKLGEAILWEHFLVHNPTWPCIRWICRQQKRWASCRWALKNRDSCTDLFEQPTYSVFFPLLIWFQAWIIINHCKYPYQPISIVECYKGFEWFLITAHMPHVSIVDNCATYCIESAPLTLVVVVFPLGKRQDVS